ncbi:hypothetical protein [Hoyosella subflava]|uniref:Secreted protein n=1 Tax=Hoyosella subflava (strain DSM 45089 / JCM 17490 / NBRC 109087 / DQS3-9A1) TaxID=443218 RepID=F6EGI6_HOYSD|nr:hypothetical protein [Hoyosella subflava]AEF41039.1 hypothetical protein AS9A_2592 [Hoyosella subflava DQS3-9A1]
MTTKRTSALAALAAASLLVVPAYAVADTTSPECEVSDSVFTCTFDAPGEHVFDVPDGVESITVSATGAHLAAPNDETPDSLAETVTSEVTDLFATLYISVPLTGEGGAAEVATDLDDTDTRIVIAAGGDGAESSLGDDQDLAEPEAAPSVVISYSVDEQIGSDPATCPGLCIDDTVYKLYELIMSNAQQPQ